MNKWLKCILCIGFALMFCFLTVGYASLNDSLFVKGTVSYKAEQEKAGVFTLRWKVGNNKYETKQYDIYKDGVYYKVTLEDLKADKEYSNNFTINNIEDDYLQLDDEGGKDIDTGSNANSFKSFLEFLDSDKTSITIRIQIKTEQGKPTEFDEGYWWILSEEDSDSGGNNDNDNNDDDDDSGSGWPSWGWPFSLNTSNVRNLSIESDEMGVYSRDAMPNLLLTLIPDEGYLLPESFTVTIGETVYTIRTNGENELEEMLFDTESSTLYILGDLLPTDGSAVFVTAYAVPETPPYTLQFNLENLTQQNYTADGGLYIQLIPDEGYLLPESFAVTIGDMTHTVYTTAEDVAGEGEPSVKDNPAGMGFDVLESKLYISGVLLPTDGSPVIISTCAELPEEEPEATEPEETTEPTEPEESTKPAYTVVLAGENLTMTYQMAEDGLHVNLIPDEAYVLTEKIGVTVGETRYTVYTTSDDAAGEGEPSVKDNPDGITFDTAGNKLFISAQLLPTDGSTVTITAHAELPEEVKTEPTEEPTEPSETEPPATEPPATEPPATEPPATEPPATEPPATEPPATEPPATEPPATEPPATEPPAIEQPTEAPTTEPVQDME